MATTVEQLQQLAADARAHPCHEAFAALVEATDRFNAAEKARDPEHLPGFVCPVCGGFFYVAPGRSEEEKELEYQHNIPEHLRSNSRVTVCSTCYADVLNWMQQKGLSPHDH